jgi:hypothetical protein
MTMAMRRLGAGNLTVHGMRSGFRDWAADTGVAFEVAERCLAHATGSAVTRAYLRTTVLERRRPVMSAWGAFLTGEADAKVVAMSAGRSVHDQDRHRRCRLLGQRDRASKGRSMIPVEVTQTPWHFTTVPDALDHWQTIIAGALALLAAVGTVWMTSRIANKQIEASREEADRVITATRDQTKVTAEQTATTVRLERMRDEGEAHAFRVMLEAGMTRVLAEAAWARSVYLQLLTQTTGASTEAVAVRQCITKGAFAELRSACVRQGGPLTGGFLDLEREIDSFASQSGDYLAVNPTIRKGMYVGLVEQLALIETKAGALRQKAFEQIR